MNRWNELDEKARRKTIIFLVAVGIALLWLTWPSSAPEPKRQLRVEEHWQRRNRGPWC